MRFKPLPEPPDSLEAVAAAQRAVPLVPDSEDDCCARLQRRRDLPSRDVARTWLTFLRALELVEETESGYRRTSADPTPEHLGVAFRARVFGAREALDAIESAAGPLSSDAVFDRLRDRIPAWERHRDPEWERRWRDRTEAVLGWTALLGLAERVDGGYVTAE